MPNLPVDCGTCLREFDPEEEMVIKLNKEYVCEECRELCAGGCGEYLSDESVAIHETVVHFRDYIYDGKLVAAHAICASIVLLGYFDLDYDHSTREEIAAVLNTEVSHAA